MAMVFLLQNLWKKQNGIDVPPIIIETVVDNPKFQIDAHAKVTYTSYITKPYNVSDMAQKIDLAKFFLVNNSKKLLEIRFTKRNIRFIKMDT